MKKCLVFLGRCLGIAFIAVMAYIYWAHIEVLPSGDFRLVFCDGDWLDQLITLFRN